MTKESSEYAKFDPARQGNIPAELKAQRRWVAWRLLRRDADKPAKVPVNPHDGREASVTNPRTWGTFAEALARFEGDPVRLHGVGFVFAAGDGLTGVDIDDCRNPETGELGPWAGEILEQLSSYTEVSPSGTGVKVVLRADVPGTASRRNKIEMYSHSRYFTITGDRLAALPPAVEARQGPLADLYREVFGAAAAPAAEAPAAPADPQAAGKDARVRAIGDDELLDRMVRAANGAKFSRLWAGSTEDHAGDQSRADASLCAILVYWSRADAARVDRLFRRSGLFRKKWDERRGDRTYGERTLANAVSSAAALWDPDREAAVADHNDLANANLFEELAEGRFRHAGALKTWLAWNGVHWDREAAVELQRALEGVAAEVKRRAELVPDQQARTRELKWAVTCGETWRYASLEKMLTWRLDVRLELLDKRPMLLACGNGVVDLAAGSFAPGRPDDWLTRATDVMYVPRAKCPRWDKFMDEIMLGDKEMVAYLWRVLGYCLTGDTSERAFFLLHGHGRNGKSTFMEVLHAMLSPGGRGYAQKARFTTFLQKGQVNGGANDDVAHLAGARLVVAAESSGRAPLDVPLVKELTGSDTIRARHLYGREFEFRPSFKLFLVTNQVPPIHESTYALWDRLHYIPFNYRVPDKDVDARLPIALMGELEGILAKAVAACREWLADGLQPPAKVLKAREALQEANDMVGEFIRECCEQRDGARQAHPELYSVFNGWSKRAGLKTPPTSKHLADALETRGWEFRRGAGNVRTWQNWELKAGQKDFGLDGPI